MSQGNAPIRVLVADDHGVVRHGVTALLSQHAGIRVIAQVASGEEAVDMAKKLQPDVVILDVRMPGMGGIEACRLVQQVSPRSKVVFLTSFPDEEALVSAMLAGAKGYVLKNLADDRLVEVVRAVARGESILDPSLGASVAEGMRRLASGTLRATPTGVVVGADSMAAREAPGRRPSSGNGLTDLETTLLQLIAEGRTNREIAEVLHFTEKTIRNYVSALLAKLDLRNRAEAAAYAVSHNLVKHD